VSFLSDLWDRLFGADKAADSASGQPPGKSACPPKLEPYIVRVVVKTRAGDIPVKDIEVMLDDASLGKSDQQGKLPDSPPRTKPSFKLTAAYVNDAEKLKREDYALKVDGISVPGGGSFSAGAANEIKKIRDVAGNRDDKNFLDIYTPSADEVNYAESGGKHVFNVLIHLATLSLNVPYLNQNSQNDTLATSASHDPEGAAHTHDVVGDAGDGKFGGGVLCFASSTTMLLWYWGKSSVKRRDVLQGCYDAWAAAGFPHRLGASAVKNAAAPADPAVGSYWLETKDPPDAKFGYALKRCALTQTWDPDNGEDDPDFSQPKAPPGAAVGKTWLDTSTDPPQRKILTSHKEWQQVPDRDWRVVIVDQGAYKIWVKWDYHKKAIDALRPPGTTANDVLDGTPIATLSDDLLPDGGPGTYAAAIAAKLSKGYPSVFGTNATSFGHIMIVRGCVMDHDNQVVRLVINDPYGTLESPKSMLHDYKISNSVGKGGTNNTDDVGEVQTVLGVLGYWDGDADGHCDGTDEDDLVQAIKKYQRAQGNRGPDGLISVGRGTDQSLKRTKGSGGYSPLEQEPNGGGTGTPAATRGKHVYYDSETKTPSGGLRLKGSWRGAVMLEKDSPFGLSELTGKLTPNSP
jgi:hypothetical protein